MLRTDAVLRAEHGDVRRVYGRHAVSAAAEPLLQRGVQRRNLWLESGTGRYRVSGGHVQRGRLRLQPGNGQL